MLFRSASAPIQSCELLDRKSLESVHDDTGINLTALLIETEAESEAGLKNNIDRTLEVLKPFKLVSSVAIILVLIAIFLPESVTFRSPEIKALHITSGEVPMKCLFLFLTGLCTSVMWGGIFNLATEGLGKYTAKASGLFMTMVVGGGVMPKRET